MNTELIQMVEDAIEICKQKLINELDYVHPEITMHYNLDGHRTLGWADRNVMNLHYALLEENPELYIKEIVLHEYVHSVIHQIYPDNINYKIGKKVKPHGREFKDMCELLGADSSAQTDSFKDSKVLKERLDRDAHNYFNYDCSCMTHKISKIKHNKILKGNKYKCGDCGEKIYYVEKKVS